MKAIAYLSLFLSISFILCVSDSDCPTSPANKEACSSLTLDSGKKCCHFSYGATPTTTCKPITVTNYNSMTSEIDTFKNKLPDKTNFASDCFTQMEVCQKIINPQQKLACTGRKIETPSSCCFIYIDKTNKSCLPIDATDLQTIVDYASKLKTDLNLEKEPEVVCASNHYSPKIIIVTLIAYLFINLI